LLQESYATAKPQEKQATDKDSKKKAQIEESQDILTTFVSPFIQKWGKKIADKYPPPATDGAIAFDKDPKYPAILLRTPTISYVNPINFWFRISVDPACIELQTIPLSPSDLGQAAAIIETDIFKFANDLGLIADPSEKGGGGHLSIDAITGFRRNSKVLAWFIYFYTETNGYWANFDEDFVNAPFLWQLTIDGRAVTPWTPSTLTPSETEISSWRIYVERLNRDFANLGSSIHNYEEGKIINPATNFDAHYRAINLENAELRDRVGNVQEKSRIEMRHYAAQESSSQLATQLHDLCDLLTLSRIFALFDIPFYDYIGTKPDGTTLSGSNSPLNDPKMFGGAKASWKEYMELYYLGATFPKWMNVAD